MKTGAWLRGGRGKIAGMVAQKSSDGKGTVLRELVVPSNPQTVDQMATRLAFGTVTQAAALMLPIIGQTFKGQSDEKLNRRRFVALNVPLLKAEALSQQAGSVATGYFRGKSSTALIPNSYIISEGTLSLPTWMVGHYDSENDQIDTPNLETGFTLTRGEYYSPSSILSALLGMEIQQQVTIVALFTADGEIVSYVAPESGDFVRDSAMRAWRINLNNAATAFEFTANMTQSELQEALRAGFDTAKTSPELISTIIESVNLNAETGRVFLDLTYADMIRQDTPDYTMVGFGVILSELDNGVWDYSRTSLALKISAGANTLNNDAYYGLSFNNALVDYLGSDAASKLYTRKGGTINTI